MKKYLLALIIILSGCSNVTNTESADAYDNKNNFNAIPFEQFIKGYNTNIDQIHDDKEKHPSHIVADDHFKKVNKNRYINTLVKESDYDSDKSYLIEGIFDENKNLIEIKAKVDMPTDKHSIFVPSRKGVQAARALLKTLDFDEDTLDHAFENANPDYSETNNLYRVTCSLMPEEKKFTLTFQLKDEI
ncbi:hypothetical protein ACT3UT_14270 [Bacillus spizizenii ATCC 6633 = JCM 2499]|uniref:Bateriophage-related protein n=2 Tax=Bacillus spizizenii TaxID=96241 RepID=E0TX36_BACSH|nr:hypothetical protein [Bacillus spizizenii]QCJ17136.1 hypothetical protein FA024_08250 [Bacillus subtilis]ADM37942.1 bateriophage-related protein [Bacillus spizizenii str. W23]AJW87278.1 hypothetical protein BIS30_20080 [Bacillus spizizenii]EFG93083.1 hypothetical protein BSU6633_05499 [Bacillus spizizenii ATCC 6633 = JCM 2499]KFK80476.1 hypothetical protein DJ97_2811 [Bacillus spizizenii]